MKLSENGYPAAFDNVGWIQISENNDYDAAIRAFRKGYELGDADCAVSLFEMIEREKWKPDNEKQVRITLLEKAAAANHAGAVVALPIERAKHGTPPNDSTAAAPKPAAASTTTNDPQQPQAQPKVPTQAPAQSQAPNPSTTKALTENRSAYICTEREEEYVTTYGISNVKVAIEIVIDYEKIGLEYGDIKDTLEKEKLATNSESVKSLKLGGNDKTLTLSLPGISKKQCILFDQLIALAKPFANARKAKAEQIQSIRHQYKSREKTLLEQVANYTSFGDEGGDSCPDRCWVQIEHCVVARETNKTIIIDFRKFNQTAFRIESYVLQGYGEQAAWNIGAFTGVADASWALIKYDTGITAITTSSIPTNWATSAFKVSFPTVDRLSKAWGLAFKECPGKKSTF